MFVKNNPLKFKHFNSTINKNFTEEYHIFAPKFPALSEHENQTLDI